MFQYTIYSRHTTGCTVHIKLATIKTSIELCFASRGEPVPPHPIPMFQRASTTQQLARKLTDVAWPNSTPTSTVTSNSALVVALLFTVAFNHTCVSLSVLRTFLGTQNTKFCALLFSNFRAARRGLCTGKSEKFRAHGGGHAAAVLCADGWSAPVLPRVASAAQSAEQ